MKSDKITIADIAKALEVSTISVSRAFSGQSGVSKELRDKILNKAQEMGYVSIKNTGDMNILVLHQKPYQQDNSNFSCRVQGIEKAIQKVGAEYSVEYVDKSNQEQLYLPYKLVKKNNFDGIIFIGRFQREYVQFLEQKIKNMVFFAGYSPVYDYDYVWLNQISAGYKQCEYLINRHHLHIGFIGSFSSFGDQGSHINFKGKERLLGVIAALEQYQIPVRREFFLDEEEDLNGKIIQLIQEESRPTAIICQWDFTAIKLIKLLYENGLRVPDDISVIGSGNTEISAVSIPALTTLDLNIEYSCEAAVDLLVKRINNPKKPCERVEISTSLIERDSIKNL